MARLHGREPEFLIAAILVLLLSATAVETKRRADEAIEQAAKQAARDTSEAASWLVQRWMSATQRVIRIETLATLAVNADLSGSPMKAQIVKRFNEIGLEGHGQIVEAIVTDPAGTFLLALGPDPAQPVRASQVGGMPPDHTACCLRSGPGTPFQHGPDGKWVLPFVETLRSDANAPIGSVTVLLDSDVAHDPLAGNDIDDRRLLAVIRKDGTVLMRSPQGAFGVNMSSTSRLMQGGDADGVQTDVVDGVRRFFAVRDVPGQNVIVAALYDEPAALAPARAVAGIVIRTGLGIGCLIAALGAGSILYLRQFRRADARSRQRRDILRQEVLLRHVAEQAGDMVELYDAEFRTLYVNEAVRQTLGSDPKGAIGKRMGWMAVPSDRSIVEAAIAALSRDGGSQRFEIRVTDAKGGIRWTESNMVAIVGGRGTQAQALRYIGISRETTERQRALDALKEAGAQLEAVMALGPGLLYRLLVAENGVQTMTMPARTHDEVLGVAIRDVTKPGFLRRNAGPADVAAQEDAVARCLATGAARAEYRFPTGSDTTCWVRDEMRAAGHDGDQRVIIGYLVDITAEHAAKARTQQTERLATLGQVASGIAHEMNQPLAVIAMAAENCQRTLAEDPIAISQIEARLKRIIIQTSRMSAVINHIGRFGRIDAQEARPFPLQASLDEALLVADERIRRAGVVVAANIPADLPWPIGVKVLLEQVLVNLLVNACDAFDESDQDARGGRRIELKATAQEGDLSLNVSDNAGGIAPHILAKVFEPFVTSKPAGKGTGLGLALSMAMMREMGGDIAALNHDDGACFTLSMKLAGPCAASRAAGDATTDASDRPAVA